MRVGRLVVYLFAYSSISDTLARDTKRVVMKSQMISDVSLLN